MIVVAMRALVGEFSGEGVELVDVTSAVLMFLLYIVADGDAGTGGSRPREPQLDRTEALN